MGRVTGLSLPLSYHICSAISWAWSLKKQSSDWRTIYHLSYPEGESINDCIPKEPYALQDVRVDDAICIVLSLGLGSYMAKTDLKSAFCLIPIHPGDWHLMGIYWQPQYHVDLNLPFGLRSTPLFIQSIFGHPGMDLTKQLRPTACAPHFERFFHR